MTIRDMMINDISNLIIERQTMRWRNFWFIPGEGVVLLYSKRDRAQANGAIHLEDAIGEDFYNLNDEKLYNSYVLVLRQSFKQM